MRSLLEPIGIRLGQGRGVSFAHGNRLTFNHLYREQIDPNATQEELDSIVGYGFWRDPIDRFKSQGSYGRQSLEFYLRLYPEYFGPGAEWDITKYNIPSTITAEMYNKLPKRIKDAINKLITGETFFRKIEFMNSVNLVMDPQTNWFCHPNMVALNFHDFTNEARRLITLFGGDPTVEIPVLNASSSFLPEMVIPPNLENFIISRYADDYIFDPRNPQ